MHDKKKKTKKNRAKKEERKRGIESRVCERERAKRKEGKKVRETRTDKLRKRSDNWVGAEEMVEGCRRGRGSGVRTAANDSSRRNLGR